MTSRRDDLLDAAIAVVGQAGIHGLTHRAVDAAANLPSGSASNLFRTRDALLTATTDRFAARERASWEEIAAQICPTTPGQLATALAEFAREATGPNRELTLARYAILVEAAIHSPLREQLMATGARVNAWFTNWVRIAGSADPGRDAPVIMNHWTGIVLHQLAGPDPAFDPLPQISTLGQLRSGTGMTTRPPGPVTIERDQIWPVIWSERLRLAALLTGLAEDDWDQPSLCAGWTIREVTAHLTLQQLSARAAIGMMVTYRGDTDRAIYESARSRAVAWPTGKIIAELRGTAGSPRHNFGVSCRESLIDVLVHAQDIAIPLGRPHPVPPQAAACATTRIWTMRWPPPFPARRVMAGFRVTATDIDWKAGQGPPVRAPISAILLLSAGAWPPCRASPEPVQPSSRTP
jgi:uncharacterized protein (TIGR03083 family)